PWHAPSESHGRTTPGGGPAPRGCRLRPFRRAPGGGPTAPGRRLRLVGLWFVRLVVAGVLEPRLLFVPRRTRVVIGGRLPSPPPHAPRRPPRPRPPRPARARRGWPAPPRERAALPAPPTAAPGSRTNSARS